MVSSCSEETEPESEFADWQAKNEAYINKLASDPGIKKILTYTKDSSQEGLSNSDYIYVDVLESGSGT
jgi:FKBP-type peptidyl-prolyl cis-trans isomerase FklB